MIIGSAIEGSCGNYFRWLRSPLLQ